MPDTSIRIEIEGLPVWRETMAAALDLLAAVEQADDALVTEEILEAAAEFRSVCSRWYEAAQ